MDYYREPTTSKAMKSTAGILCGCGIVLVGACSVAVLQRKETRESQAAPDNRGSEKQPFRRLEYNPTAEGAVGALRGLFDTHDNLEALRNAPFFRELRAGKLITTEEIAHCAVLIIQSVTCLPNSEVTYWHPEVTFAVNGWRVDGAKSRFFRIFVLEGGTKYKLTGEFVRSPKGAWKARVTHLLRLLTESEASNMYLGNSDQRRKEMVEIVPSPEEARAALVEMMEGYRLSSRDPRLRTILEFPETFESLANGKIQIDGNRVSIGGWTIWIGEGRFTVVIRYPPERLRFPSQVVGHLERAPRGGWRARGAYWGPLHHHTK